MALVWLTHTQAGRSHTPTLDRINDLLNACERGGRTASVIAMGRHQLEALPAEIAAVRAERILADPSKGGPDTVWGVPLVYLEIDDHLAVGVEESG